jgi:hypothetical protein
MPSSAMVPRIQATVPSPPAAITLKFARKYAACASNTVYAVWEGTCKLLLCILCYHAG